jgi:hypothetical protein
VSVSSDITWDSEQISFCVLHFGGHALNGSVRTFLGPDSYQSMKNEIATTFEKGDFADIVRQMDNHFGMHNYSIENLFRDQQRIILNLLITKTSEDFENNYRLMYEQNRILMGYLHQMGIPVKKAFLAAAEFILNSDLKKAFHEQFIDEIHVQNIISEINKWHIPFDTVEIEFDIRGRLEILMQALYQVPSDPTLLKEIQKRIELCKLLPLEVNYWLIQNLYYKIAKTIYHELASRASAGDKEAQQWVGTFKYIGEMLFFSIPSIFTNG